MGRGGAITLGRVKGIRIGVDRSWFLVLFLIVFWLSGFYRDILDADRGSSVPYFLALASAFGFFGSILLHELGHAFVALRNGVGISGITLWMFGGVARMERDAPSAGAEFRIAVAGPLVTLGLVGLGTLTGLLAESGGDFRRAVFADGNAAVSPLMALLGWLTFINGAVLLFNLIPAFPLDGGRIARAIVWWRTGNRSSATRLAARIGRGFAMVFVALGVYWFIVGAIVSGIWMVLLGWILGGAATSAAAQTKVQSRLEGISVADVMDAEPVAIPAGLTVADALDQFVLRYRWPWFPVVDGTSRFVGVVQARELEDAEHSGNGGQLIESLIDESQATAAAEGMKIRSDAPLESVLGMEALRSLGALMAVDPEGRLRGVLTVGRVGRALRGALQSG